MATSLPIHLHRMMVLAVSVFSVCLVKEVPVTPRFPEPPSSCLTPEMDSGHLVQRNSQTRLGFGRQKLDGSQSPEHILVSELSQILSKRSEQVKIFQVLD